jgi:HlyD family secretion protein
MQVHPASLPGTAPVRAKRRWARWLIAALVLLLAGAGTWWTVKGRKGPEIEAVTTEKAVVRTIRQVVTATGKIQPESEVKVTAEVAGEIIELPIREGGTVKKGDLLVRIKPDLYKAQVDQQAAAVSVARSAAVHSKAALAKAQSDWGQYEGLHRQGLVSQSDFILYQTNRETAEADYVAAEANVQQAEGSLNQAKDSLTKTVILSPMDGTVSLLNSEVGESVVAQSSFTGTEIMRVAQLEHMQVRVNVNENDIPHVKVGNHVAISIDAYPSRKFNGTVTAIGSSAENTDSTTTGASAQAASSGSDQVANFLVKIAINDGDITLRPGMSATANIETQAVPDAVAVPIQSVTVRHATGLTADQLQQQQAKADQDKTGNDPTVAGERADARRNRELLDHVVFVKVGGKVRLQPVETGIADNAWIEVKSGVKAGDEVVSGSYASVTRRLKDGMAVRIEQPPAEEAKN